MALHILLVVLSLLVSGLVGRRLGRPKNRATAGFVWGLLLGPLGWIVVAFSPDLRHAIERGMRHCPECRGEIPLDATRCRFCDAEVEALTEEEAWAREWEGLRPGGTSADRPENLR